ncbi:MAG: hypothetical protein P8Y63_02490 [Deltaproteobacteria bacterium]|jgi:hypothetical protein
MQFMVSIGEFMQRTQVPQQFRAVDVKGLFTNLYFLIPFLAVVGHFLYRKAVNYLILLALGIGVWIVSGTSIMHGLVVNGIVQIDKILPVAGVGVVIIAVVVYVVFIRSD